MYTHSRPLLHFKTILIGQQRVYPLSTLPFYSIQVMTTTEKFQERLSPSKDVPTAMYYPLYGGYQSSSMPVLFDNLSAALTWAITRLKKDGIDNALASHELTQ